MTVFERLEDDQYSENKRIVVIDSLGTLAEFGDWVLMIGRKAASIMSKEEFDGLYLPIEEIGRIKGDIEQRSIRESGSLGDNNTE